MKVGSKMEIVLFIETTKSGSSREALKAASQLGYFTILITERKSFIENTERFDDVYRMIYLEKITEELIRIEFQELQQRGGIIKLIVSFIDPYVSIAAHLSNELCGSDISVSALKKMEDKTETRNALKDNTTTPEYMVYKPTENLQLTLDKTFLFPRVIKSAVSKASKDVYLVDSKYEMERAIKRILKLYPNESIVLEEYLDGPQYLVEVLVYKGEITIVAIFKQEITKKLKFIVTGYEIQIDLDEQLYGKLLNAVVSIVKDLEIENAAFHIEIRYIKEAWKLVEMNPRISGGAMNRMIEEAFGINLMKETISLYLGNRPALVKRFERYIYTHYITIESYGYLLKVTGASIAMNKPEVREVYLKTRIGVLMRPPLSMGHRYGYIIATGINAMDAKANAVDAAKVIKFYLEPMN